MITPSLSLCFIVPSLESGRDGVGDYAFRLGDAMREQGVSVVWVALVDRFIESVVEEKEGRVLRIPACSSMAQRQVALERFFSVHRPHWLSLQWVGFGYDKRGLPWEMVKWIQALRQGRRLHVFFHEIWLGEKPGLPLKLKFLGALQKRLTQYAVRQWQPDVMHTSNRLYQQALARAGINGVGILPLPGNIPVPPHAQLPGRQTGGMEIALFGSIDQDWDPHPFIQALILWAESSGKKVRLISIGNQGSGQSIWEGMKQTNQSSPNLELIATGLCSPETIAEHLLQANIGATTKSFELLGKSGAFAALVDFGLPVIALRSPPESRWPVPPEKWPVAVLDFENTNSDAFSDWLNGVQRQEPRSYLPTIAKQLITDMKIPLPDRSHG